jgi:hypothetical protein
MDAVVRVFLDNTSHSVDGDTKETVGRHEDARQAVGKR